MTRQILAKFTKGEDFILDESIFVTDKERTVEYLSQKRNDEQHHLPLKERQGGRS